MPLRHAKTTKTTTTPVDDALLWEMIKLEVSESSVFCGEEKAKSRRTDETKHSIKLRTWRKQMEETMSTILKDELEQQLIEAKEDLEKV